jgi:N-(2-amino-2-carboxyethyl)-L-glutamate synthase
MAVRERGDQATAPPPASVTAVQPLPTSWNEMVRRIGGTPLVWVGMRLGRQSWRLRLKLESHNPLGSIKDRTAYSLIRAAEANRPVGERMVVVESTSGNLGAALAALCRLRGHAFIAVVDQKVSPRNLDLMRRFGARIELADQPSADGSFLADRIAWVRRICTSEPGAHWTNQYANPANPMIHFRQTGPEILRATGHEMDCIFIAASTGGTLAGIAEYLRRTVPRRSVRVVGVDAQGSVALGGQPGPRQLAGYGASRRSRFVQDRHVDETVWVADAETVAICRKLAAETGLWLGGSGGAVVAACVRYLRCQPHVTGPVCVCPDGGDKYLDSIYDDGWVHRHDIEVGRAFERYREMGLRFFPLHG